MSKLTYTFQFNCTTLWLICKHEYYITQNIVDFISLTPFWLNWLCILDTKLVWKISMLEIFSCFINGDTAFTKVLPVVDPYGRRSCIYTRGSSLVAVRTKTSLMCRSPLCRSCICKNSLSMSCISKSPIYSCCLCKEILHLQKCVL